MNKKYFVALVIAGFLVAGASYAQGVDLGVEAGTLPTSPFYFVKEWRRAIQRVFTFNAVKKAELELDILNERAAETQKISEDEPQNIDAVKSALENYIAAHDRLANKLKALKETSQNPNMDKLLDKLVEKTAKHEKLFEDISKEFDDKDEIKKLMKSAKDDLDETVSVASEKDDAEKFSERLKKDAEKEIDSKKDAAEKSAHQIKEAEEKISELEKKIQKATSTPEQAAKHLASAKEHLASAKNALGEKKYGEAFGQARSAEVLARNGMKILEKNLENENENENEQENKKEENKQDKRGTEKKNEIKKDEINKQEEKSNSQSASSATVIIGDNGFQPDEVKIQKGGKVTWVNKSQNQVWPASNPHPIHTDYPSFDASRGLANGESYSFVFDKIGSWGYHDHMNPGMRGKVKVVE